ncbi:hypothetical protein [Micromonospora sp. NPDC005313]|uniref:hypothetical protein n=1 Tax=unclassified Micromonospora TaxID=2617518 RepID=UPI0033B345FB
MTIEWGDAVESIPTIVYDNLVNWRWDMKGPLDLTALDITEVSWAEQGGESNNLYAATPTGSVEVTDGAIDGRSCGCTCGGCSCAGRPSHTWCCVNCH